MRNRQVRWHRFVAVWSVCGLAAGLPLYSAYCATRTERVSFAFRDAVNFGKTDALRRLFASGVGVDFRCYYDGQPSMVEGWWLRLRGQGVCANAEVCRGETPLMLASQSVWERLGMQPSVVSFLLEQGANPNAVDEEGATALHKAAGCGAVGAVRLLLRYGANPTLADRSGVSPLDCARGLAPSTDCPLFGANRQSVISPVPPVEAFRCYTLLHDAARRQELAKRR